MSPVTRPTVKTGPAAVHHPRHHVAAQVVGAERQPPRGAMLTRRRPFSSGSCSAGCSRTLPQYGSPFGQVNNGATTAINARRAGRWRRPSPDGGAEPGDEQVPLGYRLGADALSGIEGGFVVRRTIATSVIADPGIEDAVEDVGDDVHDHDADPDTHHDRHHHRVVDGPDGVDVAAPNPGPAEDRFGDDRPADDGGDVEGTSVTIGISALRRRA